MYLKLMIDGVAPPPFSANTLPPLPRPEISYRKEIIKESRQQYAYPVAEVEKQIAEWSAAMFGRPAPEIAKPFGSRPQNSDFGPRFQNNQSSQRNFPQNSDWDRRSTGTSQARRPAPDNIGTGASISEAFKTGPVDFKGRRITPHDEKEKSKNKPVVNTSDLKQTLEGILSKHDKDKTSS